eukprot:scaffold85518_cov37-Tisochrysis_lutea.AAC.4
MPIRAQDAQRAPACECRQAESIHAGRACKCVRLPVVRGLWAPCSTGIHSHLTPNHEEGRETTTPRTMHTILILTQQLRMQLALELAA